MHWNPACEGLSRSIGLLLRFKQGQFSMHDSSNRNSRFCCMCGQVYFNPRWDAVTCSKSCEDLRVSLKRMKVRRVRTRRPR